MTRKLKRFLQPVSQQAIGSAALLLLRLVVGAAFVIHGSQKMQNPLGWMGPQSPVPGFFQLLASISEFGGGIAWILGLLTPLAGLGIGCTMAAAVYMHSIVMKNPFVNLTGGLSYELASAYLCIAIVLIVLGPGRFSLDNKIFGGRTGTSNDE
ncbi:MAG: DoxX family protein [Betaproteobacteria bacterium]